VQKSVDVKDDFDKSGRQSREPMVAFDCQSMTCY